MPGESSLNKKVEDWWNQNPFTYNGRLGVGRVPEDQLDLAFFEKVERKIRKQGNYQGVNQPLLSYFIDYDRLKGKKFWISEQERVLSPSNLQGREQG